jgi:hypothetical protein
MICFRDGWYSGRRQSGACIDPKGAATTSRGASLDAGNVAESRLFLGARPTINTIHLELFA